MRDAVGILALQGGEDVNDVTLRREAYDDGDHYEECEGRAQDQGMGPMLSFDHVDVASKQLPELAAFMGRS